MPSETVAIRLWKTNLFEGGCWCQDHNLFASVPRKQIFWSASFNNGLSLSYTFTDFTYPLHLPIFCMLFRLQMSGVNQLLLARCQDIGSLWSTCIFLKKLSYSFYFWYSVLSANKCSRWLAPKVTYSCNCWFSRLHFFNSQSLICSSELLQIIDLA